MLTKIPGNNVINKKNKRIHFIEQMFLSPGVVTYLVRVDEQEFLLGVSNKTINFIQPLKGIVDFATVLKDKEQNTDKIADEILEKSIEKKGIFKNKVKANTKDSKDGSS
ncbi:MAG: flagellar biosynthetic protein FliO [Candidatus Riflemargulisbacteria bacterium]